MTTLDNGMSGSSATSSMSGMSGMGGATSNMFLLHLAVGF